MGINNQAVQNKIKKVSEFDVFFMEIDATAGQLRTLFVFC